MANPTYQSSPTSGAPQTPTQSPSLRGLAQAASRKKPIGTSTPSGGVAAYMPPSEGPFECDNCQFYVGDGHCQKPEVINELGADESGMAQVDAQGCCNFFKKGSSGGLVG